MKSFLLVSAVTALAATSANAIVLPEGSNFNTYHQFGNNHPLPRADEPSKREGIKIPMYHQSKRDFSNPGETLAFAHAQLDYVQAKWGKGAAATKKREELKAKRQTIGLSDAGQDNFYFGQVSVGTPKQNFNVILDTGSADFWLADSSCTNNQCAGINLFNPSASSTYRGSSTPFQITYGTGAVRGTLAADAASLAGYTVNSQTFAVVDTLASNSLQQPTTGIMGMGFQSLATSQATPLWQVLVEQNKLTTNLFTFQMARNVNTAGTNSISPGGVFTLGELDANQYNGNINYVNLSGQEGYWTIPMDAVSINGQTSSVNGDSISAIDTGTTLIIAPPQVAQAIYGAIPGSQSLDSYFSSSQGAYAIPCSSNIQLALTFGGQSYSINSDDMKSGAIDNDGNCLGGILGTSLGSGAPSFIVGNVFLKNVFSVYRYEPAAVGFAALKGQAAQTAATTTGAVGSAGNPDATGTASAGSGNNPPVFSSVSASAGDSSIAAGSGLPTPTAASTNDPSTPSLIAADGENSNAGGASSGAAPSFTSAVSIGGTMTLAMLLGVVATML